MPLLLSLLLLLGTAGAARGQVRHQSEGQGRADVRRAQREGRRHAHLPYHDTHLNRPHLERGEGHQPRPEGADAYDYSKGNSPSASDRNIWGLRRKKTKAKP